MKHCVIHANCQGDPLVQLLLSQPEFAGEYTIRKYTNYLHETIPDEELSSCALFLYQPLGEKWNDLASEGLLAKVSPHAVAMPIPNMLFKGYWPFWTNKSPMDFGDSYLDALVDMGLDKAEIMYIATKTDITRKYDIPAMFQESVAYERSKEEGCVVQTVDLILEHYQTEKLFNTINHPNRRLILHVAEGILATLGMSALPSHVTASFSDPYDDFELPIHPQVAEVMGLLWADAQTTYNIYGKQKTYEEYIANYVDCRLLGLDNFIGYLQLV